VSGAGKSTLPRGLNGLVIALDCLDRVGLLERALDRVETLSGGMQQHSHAAPP